MKDRISLYPGRVRLEPVEGQENVFDMTRADQPKQEGTALCKANLLTDETAAKLGLAGEDPTVDDALGALLDAANSKAQIATGSYVGTGTCGSANPCSLTFPFVPKILMIQGNDYFDHMLWIYNGAGQCNPNGYIWEQNVTVSGNTLSWYATGIRTNGSSGISGSGTSGEHQMNKENAIYYYVAVG